MFLIALFLFLPGSVVFFPFSMGISSTDCLCLSDANPSTDYLRWEIGL